MISKRSIIATAAMVITCGMWSLAPGAVAGERIVVLLSSSEPPFENTLAGFQGYLAKQGVEAEYEVYPLAGDPSRAVQAVEKAKKRGTHLIFTLGSLGTDAVLKNIDDIPVVACLVLRTDNLARSPNATGVGLEFPLEIQFRWLQKMLPDAKTIGVIYNPDENKQRVKEAAGIARGMGLSLEAQEVHSLRDIPDALKDLSRSADVLWGLADSLVLSPQIAKHLLLFSFRNSIPFIGPSAAWVKAGALYSLDWDYTDMGMQCGEMAVQVLQGKRPNAIPAASARKVLYSVNLKTAQQIKVPISEQLTKKALNIY